MSWTRHTLLDGVPERRLTERWVYDGPDGPLSCSVDVTVGKPLDVRALKRTDLNEIRRYAEFLKAAAAQCYGADSPHRVLARCPACDGDLADAAEILRVFGVPYHRCGQCGHGVVREQPSEEILEAIFTTSDEHASVYVDRDSLDVRMRQVIAPKVEWVFDMFGRHVGGRMATALDIGAGGGHFVAGLRAAGVDAAGFELSEASRRFAREAFGIALRTEPFLECAPTASVDLVTLWGLLEYTPDPRRFLDAARRHLVPGRGLLVVEVPRLNALGTAVQAVCAETVARHMDPTSHVNAFTDSSLATCLVRSGFRPVAAWYFGMDVYELLVQAALRLGDTAFDRLADLIPPLQSIQDQGRVCDDLVIAAVPMDEA